MMGYRLSKKEKKRIKNSLNLILAAREEVIFAYLHGSFFSANWFRDVDVGVFVDEKKVSRKEVLDYEIAFSLYLEKELCFPVDVKVLNYAPLGFKYEVTKGEVAFNRNEEMWFSFLEKTWHHYLDYAPMEREFIEEIL